MNFRAATPTFYLPRVAIAANRVASNTLITEISFEAKPSPAWDSSARLTKYTSAATANILTSVPIPTALPCCFRLCAQKLLRAILFLWDNGAQTYLRESSGCRYPCTLFSTAAARS